MFFIVVVIMNTVALYGTVRTIHVHKLGVARTNAIIQQ
jgi:hypothetical protein